MPRNLLYLDPWSGLSGDMLLAALLDAGGPEAEQALRRAVASLRLEDVGVRVVRGCEWGISCTRVQVAAEQSPPLRHLEEMLRVIDEAELSDGVKTRAGRAIRRLADVEAGIHGCPVEHIHFHEVGAADTLVDVVGAFVLTEALMVDEVVVGTIPVGGGSVQIAHGRMGVPAPATAALLEGYQIVGGPEMRELTTPTGALLVRELGARQGALPAMKVTAVGYGAGTMKLEHGPNLLRLVLGQSAADAEGAEATGVHTVIELQTNVDDVSAETLGYALRRLREAGALDAWLVPVQMKKDRPGFVLHALVSPDTEGVAVDVLFSETGTLGVRRDVLTRYVADRGAVTVTVRGREIRVKWGTWKGSLTSLSPEYEDAAAAASSLSLPLQEVMWEAKQAARHALELGERR